MLEGLVVFQQAKVFQIFCKRGSFDFNGYVVEWPEPTFSNGFVLILFRQECLVRFLLGEFDRNTAELNKGALLRVHARIAFDLDIPSKLYQVRFQLLTKRLLLRCRCFSSR